MKVAAVRSHLGLAVLGGILGLLVALSVVGAIIQIRAGQGIPTAPRPNFVPPGTGRIGDTRAAANWSIRLDGVATATALGGNGGTRAVAQGIFVVLTLTFQSDYHQRVSPDAFTLQDRQGETFSPSTAAAVALADSPPAALLVPLESRGAVRFRLVFDVGRAARTFVLRADDTTFSFTLAGGTA